MAADWSGYLTWFHAERPGITEDLLDAAHDGGDDPYSWVTELTEAGQVVLDLACGSGPLHARVGRGWVGLDNAPAELGRAWTRGRVPLVRAQGSALPFPGQSFDLVACSMALMLLEPLPVVLAEVARVLRPAGRLVALLPATGPLRVLDKLRYARLMAALGCRLGYPNEDVLSHPGPALDRAGLHLVTDRRRRFTLSLRTPEVAGMLVRSLYLPEASPERVGAAMALARSWTGKTLGIPLRRVVAERRSGDPDGGLATRDRAW